MVEQLVVKLVQQQVKELEFSLVMELLLLEVELEFSLVMELLLLEGEFKL